MKRILSGIQPSGKLHIGNYFGMIKRMIAYQEDNELFCFIADLHSLTTLKNDKPSRLAFNAAIDLLALGIDPEKTHFWIQSDVPEVTELAWILSCQTPIGLMQRSVSYKDKVSKGIEPNLGLFNYPNLMAADILINQADLVPTGKDQQQHLEITRNIAKKFNNNFGNVFTIPEPDIDDSVSIIPGINGQKMSKSYKNTIPIFDSEKAIRKAVMSIVTDTNDIDPKNCNIVNIYKHFATEKELEEVYNTYRTGGVRYGDVKNILADKIISTFKPFHEKRNYLQSNPDKIELILEEGANKVKEISKRTLNSVKEAIGI